MSQPCAACYIPPSKTSSHSEDSLTQTKFKTLLLELNRLSTSPLHSLISLSFFLFFFVFFDVGGWISFTLGCSYLLLPLSLFFFARHFFCSYGAISYSQLFFIVGGYFHLSMPHQTVILNPCGRTGKRRLDRGLRRLKRTIEVRK